MLMMMIVINSGTQLCFHINCTVFKLYAVGLKQIFSVVFRQIWGWKVHSAPNSDTVCSKRYAFLSEVRGKTKCAILFKLIKTRKQVGLCPQNLYHFHDKTTLAFSLLQTIESFQCSLLSKPLRLVLQSLHQGCATGNREGRIHCDSMSKSQLEYRLTFS